MRKAKNCNKKRAAIVLTGTLALTGVVSAIPMPMLGNPLAAAVYAADATNYSTVKGIATMGSGQAENAKGGESINYTFNPVYEQALKNVVSKALTKAGTTVTAANVTEYQVIDYIQSLNNYPVEGDTTEQKLESRYSAFRYFIEELRDEMTKLNEVPEVVNVKNVRSDNSIRLD